jgi:hypothetical protein
VTPAIAQNVSQTVFTGHLEILDKPSGKCLPFVIKQQDNSISFMVIGTIYNGFAAKKVCLGFYCVIKAVHSVLLRL